MTDCAVIRAREEEAGDIVAAGGPFLSEDRWPALFVGPAASLEMGSLTACALGLDDAGVQDLAARDARVIAEGDPDAGPWLIALPDELAPALRALDAAGISEVAWQWAARDDVRSYPKDQVEQTVGALAELAKDARSGEHLMLWIEL